MARIKGTVKWFSESKGYGFITPSDGTGCSRFNQWVLQLTLTDLKL